MSPIAENNTPCLFVDYTSGGVEHTLVLRFAQGSSQTDAITNAQDLCIALSPYVNANDSFFRARWRAQGATFSLPVEWETVDGTSTGAAFVEDPESAFVSVCGRSIGGRRVRWSLYTVAKVSTNWPDDNRYQAGESTNADAIRDAFSFAAGESPLSPLVAIDDNPVVVYDYVNIAKSGYWTRKQRTSS